MFRRVTIKNFRSIAAAAVELTPFTVVVGPNGAGKSNLVEVFAFLRDVARDAETAMARRGGFGSVRRWSRSRPLDMSLCLRIEPSRKVHAPRFLEWSLTIGGGDGSWRIKTEAITHCDGAQTMRWVRSSGVIRGAGIPDDEPFEIDDRVSAMVQARQVLGLRADAKAALLGVHRYRLAPDQMRIPREVAESSRLDENGGNIARAVASLREANRLGDVLLAMQRIVPGLVDVETSSNDGFEMLRFRQQQTGGVATFGTREMSDGALRALGIIVAASQMARNELLIVEEPEASVHVGAAALLHDVLREASRRGAVLVTTHSPELLEAASADDILVCSYEDGVTRLGPLAESQRGLVRQGLFSVAELMRSEPLRIEGAPIPTVKG